MGVGNFFGIELLLKILQKGAQVFFVHAFERHVGMVEEILVLMLRWFAVTDDGDVLGRVFGDQRCYGVYKPRLDEYEMPILFNERPVFDQTPSTHSSRARVKAGQ